MSSAAQRWEVQVSADDATGTFMAQAFLPGPLIVRVGDTVTWKWVGSNPHNVQFKGFKSKTITKGTYKHTFKKRGTFRYVCIIHSGMNGKVIVK